LVHVPEAATHCNTLQHTATYCNMLQRHATHAHSLASGTLLRIHIVSTSR